MRTSVCLPWLVVALAFAPIASAETSIAWQFGAAHNHVIESTHISGAHTSISVPPVDRWDAYVGVQIYYHLSDNLALGAGTRLLFDRWPMDRSDAFWELDVIGLEYRLFDDIRLRASGGLAKVYEKQVAYGRAYNLALVGPLTQTLDWGVGYMAAQPNQESGYLPNINGGSARAWTLFLEYRVGP